MLAEWVRLHLHEARYAVHARLSGPDRAGYIAEGHSVYRALVSTWPEADLVCRDPTGTVSIVEFIVHRPQETVGQLLYYMWMLPGSVGYEDVDPVQVRGRVVTGLSSPRFQAFVEYLGLEYEEYKPEWLLQAIAKRRGGTSPEDVAQPEPRSPARSWALTGGHPQ